MFLRSASRRAFEMTVAERMKMKNNNTYEVVPLVPLDAKPRRKEATAE